MIEAIKNSDADILISSRVEIAELLSKDKKDNVITITEEHCHHNNNEKYINNLLIFNRTRIKSFASSKNFNFHIIF